MDLISSVCKLLCIILGMTIIQTAIMRVIQRLRKGTFPEWTGKGKVLNLLFFSVLSLKEVKHAGLAVNGSPENQLSMSLFSKQHLLAFVATVVLTLKSAVYIIVWMHNLKLIIFTSAYKI